MKRSFSFFLSIFALMAVFALAACSSKPPPMTVSKDTIINLFGRPTPVIYITAKADKVEINGIDINRGGCPNYELKHVKSRTLKFGETLLVYAAQVNPCNIQEVQLTTVDGGSWKFEFN